MKEPPLEIIIIPLISLYVLSLVFLCSPYVIEANGLVYCIEFEKKLFETYERLEREKCLCDDSEAKL